MLKIGLTGGIGSGKTTVANLFKDMGATIIDSDEIARDLTQPNTAYYHKIITHFGKKVVREDGQLNRPLMRELVFADKKEREWLEQLLHPPIIDLIVSKMNSSHTPYCIAVVPLLVETNLAQLFDRILVIDTSQELQLKRTMARDQSDVKTIETILDSQSSAQKRLAGADDIITNTGNLAQLSQQVKKLDQLYRKLSNQRK